MVKKLFAPAECAAGMTPDKLVDAGDDGSIEDEDDDELVESTADAGAIRYGPKNSSAMTVSNATKRVFFINMTIAKSWKETYVATDLDLNNSYFTQPPTHKELFDGCEAQCKVSQDVIN